MSAVNHAPDERAEATLRSTHPAKARIAHGFGGVCCLSPSDDRSALLVDIYDVGDALLVVASAPGALPEDVRIETAATVATVTVVQRPYSKPQGCETIRRERYAAPWKREIELPFAVAASDIAQTLERGVLTLRIAKPPSFQGAQER